MNSLSHTNILGVPPTKLHSQKVNGISVFKVQTPVGQVVSDVPNPLEFNYEQKIRFVFSPITSVSATNYSATIPPITFQIQPGSFDQMEGAWLDVSLSNNVAYNATNPPSVHCWHW